MKTLRRYIIPYNADEGVPADFLAAFGVEVKTDEPPADSKDKGAGETDPPIEDNKDDKNDKIPEPGDKGEPSKETEPLSDDKKDTKDADKGVDTKQTDKAAAAFAAMRVENASYKKMMQDIAGILGVSETENFDTLSAALQEKILDAQSKQQNIPKELLQKIKSLEADSHAARMERLHVAAYRGFQNVKDTFKIDDKQLQDFAATLQKEGLNPFTQELDLVAEYKIRNYDELIEAARKEGAKEEAARVEKANAHSTTPGKDKGQSGGDTAKINTIADLNTWFASQAK